MCRVVCEIRELIDGDRYYTTLPTDALMVVRDAIKEAEAVGLEKLRGAMWDQVCCVCDRAIVCEAVRTCCVCARVIGSQGARDAEGARIQERRRRPLRRSGRDRRLRAAVARRDGQVQGRGTANRWRRQLVSRCTRACVRECDRRSRRMLGQEKWPHGGVDAVNQTFRLGLFGLDKLSNVDGSVARLSGACAIA
jgi:hypothetical protein